MASSRSAHRGAAASWPRGGTASTAVGCDGACGSQPLGCHSVHAVNQRRVSGLDHGHGRERRGTLLHRVLCAPAGVGVTAVPAVVCGKVQAYVWMVDALADLPRQSVTVCRL